MHSTSVNVKVFENPLFAVGSVMQASFPVPVNVGLTPKQVPQLPRGIFKVVGVMT